MGGCAAAGAQCSGGGVEAGAAAAGMGVLAALRLLAGGQARASASASAMGESVEAVRTDQEVSSRARSGSWACCCSGDAAGDADPPES